MRRHWIAFALVVAVDGRMVIDGAAIRRGQDVWRSIGGQEVGSIWGHGAYVAPDWTADWLHREAVGVLDAWARREGAGSYAQLAPERQAALRERLALGMRKNTFDPASGTVTLSPERALFVGLWLWLALLARALWPVLRGARGPLATGAGAGAALAVAPEARSLLGLFLIASLAIALLYGAGLLNGREAHLAVAEYWRWWVVHLWVEGFFEVFASVVIAFLRIPGDTLFAVGALVLGWFVLGLRTGWSLEKRGGAVASGSTEVRIPAERRPATESA